MKSSAVKKSPVTLAYSRPNTEAVKKPTKNTTEHKKYKARRIHTYYYDDKGNVVKMNRSAHTNSAVVNAFSYMQSDYYQAKTCEVINAKTGLPVAVLGWRFVKGKPELATLYEEDPKELK